MKTYKQFDKEISEMSQASADALGFAGGYAVGIGLGVLLKKAIMKFQKNKRASLEAKKIAKDLKKIKGVNESLQLNENVVGDVKKYFLGKLQKIKKELSNPETIDKIKVTAKLLALYAFIGLFFKDQFDKGRLTPMADGKVYSASDLNNITKDYVSILKSAK